MFFLAEPIETTIGHIDKRQPKRTNSRSSCHPAQEHHLLERRDRQGTVSRAMAATSRRYSRLHKEQLYPGARHRDQATVAGCSMRRLHCVRRAAAWSLARLHKYNITKTLKIE